MVRIKHRYLLVNILYADAPARRSASVVSDLVVYNQPTTDALDASTLLKGIRAQIASLFGDYGSGTTTSLQVKYLSTATSTFILKISREYYRLVWAVLTFMNQVPVRNGRPCVFRVVRVSGTIRKVEQELIRRAKILIQAAKSEMAGKSSSDALHSLFGGDGGSSGSGVGGRDRARELTMVDDPDDGSAFEDGEASDDG